MENQKILFVKDLRKAITEIAEHQATVLEVLNSKVIVVKFADDFDSSALEYAQETPYQKLDVKTQLLLNARNNRFTSSLKPKETVKTHGLSWGHPDYQPQSPTS